MEEVKAVPQLDEDLLDEVTRLVEVPTALRGDFDPRSLSLPKEVLVSLYQSHRVL